MAGPHTAYRGVALLTGLVLLSALSLLALVAATSALSQQRMAGNHDDAALARAQSDRALAEAARLVLTVPEDRRRAGCRDDCFLSPTDQVIRGADELPALPEFEPGAWWRAEGWPPGTDPVTAGAPDSEAGSSADLPRFTVEEILFRLPGEIVTPPGAPAIAGLGYYRVLGRGTGRQAGTVSVGEALIARPWIGTPPEAAQERPPADWAEYCAPFQPWYDCGPLTWRARR